MRRTGRVAGPTTMAGRCSRSCSSRAIASASVAVRNFAEETDILIGEASAHRPIHEPRQLGIVAEVGMGIERQVIGEQVDIARQQRRQPRLANSRYAPVLTAPEIAVVHDDGIGIARHRRVKQSLTGRDAGDDAANLAPPFHLQTVWAIIAVSIHLQQFVEIALKIRVVAYTLH